MRTLLALFTGSFLLALAAIPSVANAAVACITSASGSCSCTSTAGACSHIGGTPSSDPNHVAACCPIAVPNDDVVHELADASGFCGDTVPVKPTDVVVAQADGSLLVFEGGGDAALRAGPKVVYTCDCKEGSGSCNPTWDGSKAGCVSMTCSDCKLQSSRVRAATAVAIADATATQCSAVSVEEEAALKARESQVLSYLARAGIEMPISANGEISVGPGYRIVVEEVGGRTIGYPVADARAAGGKAKCSCQGSGTCDWQGIVCSPTGWPDGCQESCQIVVKERAQRASASSRVVAPTR